jgi:hypothetical protein
LSAKQGEGATDYTQEAQTSNDTGEKPLTRKEVAEMIDSLASKQFRALQSMQASHDAETQKEIKSQLETLRKAGVEVTPQQAEIIQNSIKERMTQDDNVEPQNAPQATPQQAQAETQQNPVVSAAMKIMDKYGVKLEQGDPELAMVNNQTQDPGEFLASVVDAVLAKRDRTGQENAPKNGKVPAIAGVGMASGALPNDLPSTDYFKMGYKK